MWNNETGKYIGYFTSIEGSAIGFSDSIEELKGVWCFGLKIFQNTDMSKTKLAELFPNKPERGVVLYYLSENFQEVGSDGTLIVPDKEKIFRDEKIKQILKS